LNTPPAIYEEVFTTAAVDSQGNLVFFSSLGPVPIEGIDEVKPNIAAPGFDVLSAFPEGSYEITSGTSMAGPHIVGVVALMWSANPDLIGDIDTTEAILQETAQPYQGPLPNCPGASEIPSTAVGYGIVDAFAAVQRAIELANQE
jgi:subtilisin family serine protease